MSDVEEMLNQLLASADLTVPSGALANELSELILARKIDHIRVDTKPDGFIIFYNNRFQRRNPFATPRSLSAKQIITTTHEALMNAPAAETDWLIDGVLRNASIGLFGGKTASYKTWIGLELAYSVASGKEWIGFRVKQPVGVLFIDEENGSVEIQRRLKMLNKPNLANLYFTDIQNIKLDDDEENGWLKELGRYCKENPNIKLIFVDTYRRVVGYDENDAGRVSEFINSLKQFIKENGVAILFTHHFRKTGTNTKGISDIEEYEEFRGSSDFVNSAESIFMVSNLHGEGSAVRLKCLKLRQGQKFTDKILRISENDGKIIINKIADKEKTLASKDECAKKIMEWAAKNYPEMPFKSGTAKDAMLASGFSKTTIADALDVLRQAGELSMPKFGWYKLVQKQGSLNE